MMLYFLTLGLAMVTFLCIVEAVIYWNKSRKERTALNKKLMTADYRRKILENEKKAAGHITRGQNGLYKQSAGTN